MGWEYDHLDGLLLRYSACEVGLGKSKKISGERVLGVETLEYYMWVPLFTRICQPRGYENC